MITRRAIRGSEKFSLEKLVMKSLYCNHTPLSDIKLIGSNNHRSRGKKWKALCYSSSETVDEIG